MIVARIGVQTLMLKSAAEKIGAYETLRRVREIGYRAVEVSQFAMTDAGLTEMERAHFELGIEFAALSVSLDNRGAYSDAIETDFDRIVAYSRRLETGMLRIGMLPPAVMASSEALLSYCDRLEVAACRLADVGIGLHFHNHHLEFAKQAGRHLLDIMLERMPTIGLELDVHWIQRGGLDPVTIIRRYADRIRMVHLKDYRIGSLPSSAAESLADGRVEQFLAAFAAVVEFAEVGEGNLNFAAIVPAAIDSGAEYLFVEQDELFGVSAWDALRTSRDNLRSLGFADLF